MPYSEVTLSTHALIPKAELKKPLELLKEQFTLVSRFENNVEIELFKETPTHFGVPLHHTNIAAL